MAERFISMESPDEDDDGGMSSDEGNNSPGRSARLDREMADLIRESQKFLACKDGQSNITKKRISRATRPFQYSDHDDRLQDSSDQYSTSSRHGERSRSRRRHVQTYPPLYSDTGIHLASGRDLCDCLDTRCPGCHEECKACGTQKCGMECRSNRTWCHREVIQFHPHKPKEIIRSGPV